MTGRQQGPSVNRNYAGVGTCAVTGKAIHPTRARAKTVRNRLPDGTRLSVYPCPHCQGYHLGHKPTDVRRGTYDKDEWLGRTRPE